MAFVAGVSIRMIERGGMKQIISVKLIGFKSALQQSKISVLFLLELQAPKHVVLLQPSRRAKMLLQRVLLKVSEANSGYIRTHSAESETPY